MPLTIRVNCPHCNHAGIRVGEPGHSVTPYPSGFFVDPAIECPSCHAPFVVRASRAEARSRVHPPLGVKLPDTPAHVVPPPKLKAVATKPAESAKPKPATKKAKRSRGKPKPSTGDSK